MKNLKIQSKLVLVFGVLLFCFLGAGVTGILSIVGVDNSLAQFYDKSYQMVATELETRIMMQSTAKDMLWAAQLTDPQKAKEHLDTSDSSWSEVEKRLPVLKEKYLGDQSKITQVENLLKQAAPYREQIISLIQQNDREGALKIFNEQYAPLSVAVRGSLDQIGQEASARAAQRYQDGQIQTRNAFFLMLAILLAGLVLMAAFGRYLTRAITAPLRQIQTAAEEIANGNLDAEIDYRSRDEMGALSDSMRKTIHSLKSYIDELIRVFGELSDGNFQVGLQVEFAGEFVKLEESVRTTVGQMNGTLLQINRSAEQVAAGADQVADGAQALSQGATEQAGSLEELAATITEISKRVDENAGNAANASGQASEISAQLERSNQEMHTLVDAMKGIDDSSGEIQKINKTISDIAFQTNILALNAAVEAARAGAAGKGFAVVADEVRNLAAKSAEASKSTEALIDRALADVRNGVEIAGQTAQSLLSVVESAHANRNMADEISASSQEQSASIDQVTQGIDQITAVVQNNSATAEESAATSEELSGQARMMRELVGHFRLKENG